MLKKILLGIVMVLIVIQFIRTDNNHATERNVKVFETETEVNTEVKTILTTKCYDCHSNKTTYPWYTNIAPLSFWTNHHVKEGKEHLDFSNWANYKAKRKAHKLDELIEEVEEDKMPLKSYKLLHGDLTANEKELLVTWAKKATILY